MHWLFAWDGSLVDFPTFLGEWDGRGQDGKAVDEIALPDGV
jgi:hypothetical protein